MNIALHAWYTGLLSPMVKPVRFLILPFNFPQRSCRIKSMTNDDDLKSIFYKSAEKKNGEYKKELSTCTNDRIHPFNPPS